MSRITLVNPNRMKPGVAPLALDYLAESLAAAGHNVRILDLCFSHDWQVDLDAHFAADQTDVVGITIRNTDDCYFASRDFFIPFFKDVIDRIRSRTDARIVLGGSGFSVAAKSIMEFTGADYAIIGEGEAAFPLLASCLDRRDDVSNVPALVYRTPDGVNGNVPTRMDLAQLPPRSRKWLNNRQYFNEGGQAGIETKRGCDRKCIYCADPVGKGRMCRLRPPAHVLDEIRELLNQTIDCFHLCDSEFNIPIDHAEAVCREIIDTGLAGGFRWYTYASPAPFTDELAALMKRAGCVGIDFGVDSGDDTVLRSLGRDFAAQDIRRTAEICRRHGITFMCDLLIGGPGETCDSVKRTIDQMQSINPSQVGVSVGIRIYDCTPLGGMVRREGISKTNPALHGCTENNDDFLVPVYYLSPEVGIEIVDYVDNLIQGDQRFLFASMDQIDRNYNYNDNSLLVRAIRNGHRGAYWDILRRVREGLPPVGK